MVVRNPGKKIRRPCIAGPNSLDLPSAAATPAAASAAAADASADSGTAVASAYGARPPDGRRTYPPGDRAVHIHIGLSERVILVAPDVTVVDRVTYVGPIVESSEAAAVDERSVGDIAREEDRVRPQLRHGNRRYDRHRLRIDDRQHLRIAGPIHATERIDHLREGDHV
jgi:hypothetical protein